MIKSTDKGIKKVPIVEVKKQDSNEAKGSFKDLPKYLCYKAALIREKLILSYFLIALGFTSFGYFIYSRYEISHLYQELRKKEFILAPGVKDFSVVNPQSVPDSYVNDAVTDFISSLGNVNSYNIEEEYNSLKKFMSDDFQIKFSAETQNWIKQVQTEDLAQIVQLKSKKIASDQEGRFKITAFVRADFYAVGNYLGHENQVIEMELKLIPPDRKHRWYLQITNLNWSKLEMYNQKSEMKSQN